MDAPSSSSLLRREEYVAVALFIFLASVHGLATAIAVLKIGRFIFGVGYCEAEKCASPKHPFEHRKFLGRIPKVGDLFYCTPCLSFWIGMIFSWKVLSPARAVCSTWWQAMVLDGLMACAVSWVLFLIAKKLGADEV